MGIVLGSNFDVQTALPLDSRLVVADLTARDAIDSLQRYEGMIVYVESEETNFQLIGGTANENWAELSGSGSGGGSGSGLNYISGAPEVYQGSRVITLGSVPVDETGDAVTATSHGITTGQKVRYDTDGTEIGGLTSGTTYYAISATANALQFATSYENAKAGTAIDLSSDGSGTQTLTVDLDEATGGTPTVTVEETSDVSALTYKFSKDDADRFGEGLSFPVAIDAIDFEKTRKQIVTFFYKTSTDYVDRDIRVMLYDVENETFIEVKGGLDDNGELPASADIIEFRGYFHPASDSGNYRLAFNINSENTDAYDIYLGRVKITSEENIPVSGISPLIFGDDSHFEGTIGNWKKYKDAASEAPEDGDGGTPGIIFLRGTTEVLGGDAEGLLVHDGGSDYQGEGVALEKAVTPTNRAKDNKIQFFYSAFGDFTFGGFGSNSSVMVHLYDVTNGKHLNPYPGFLDGSGFYEGYCQIPHDCETIRLILHVATDSTDGWVLAVKKFQIDIAPNEFVKADSDWESYTPELTGVGTPTNVHARFRKNGPNIEILGGFTSGTATGTEFRCSLPNELVSETQTPSVRLVGQGQISSTGTDTTARIGSAFSVLIESEKSYFTVGYRNTGTGGLTKVNANSLFTSGEIVSFFATIPIKGWTSGNLTAASANLNAPVVLSAYKSGGSVTGGALIGSWTAVEKDTVGGFDATTGEYIIKVPGDYVAIFNLQTTDTSANGNTRADIFLNGSAYRTGIAGNGEHGAGSVVAFLQDLKVGDVVSPRSANSRTIASNTTGTRFSIFRVETSGRVYKTRVAYLKDVKASGTVGGAATTGSFQTRVLNTLEGDKSFVSLSSNQFTLQPGTYQIDAEASFYRVNEAKIKLRNITDSSDTIIGMSGYARATDNEGGSATLSGTFSIAQATTFEIQYRVTTNTSTSDLGVASGFGVDEVYTVVKIEKVL